MMFDKNLLEQFKTNRYERMATLGLALLIVMGLVASKYYQDQNIKSEKTDPELVHLLDEYYANKPEETKTNKDDYERNDNKKWPKKSYPKFKKENYFKKEIEHSLFAFDPNTVGYHDLIKLSFTSKQANTLLKFRSYGFEFKSLEDLEKVHGLDQNLLDKITPFVNLPQRLDNNKTQDSTNKARIASTSQTFKPQEIPIVKVEINSASQEDLIGIYGIGKVYAGILIKYRDRLGGYAEFSQIKEGFDFPDSTISILQKSLIIDSSDLSKININEVTFKELLAHPYVSYEHNQILFPFIKKRRPIKDLEVLNEILVLDSSLINKLIPYLKVE